MGNSPIHVATISHCLGDARLLVLRQLEPSKYVWFLREGGGEEETEVHAKDPLEAIRLARRHWKNESFTPLRCGYRFTLPERDEHGNNALFHQMVKSLNSLTGIYFDEELGHNCVVHQIPSNARRLYQELKSL